jgi:ElaB/YqjD/DUF883 family membrane-anchored ribosome-binding protein
MSKEERKEALLPEELRREIKERIEKGLEELRKRAAELAERRKEIIEDKALLAIGISFIIGFALGALLSRSKDKE